MNFEPEPIDEELFKLRVERALKAIRGPAGRITEYTRQRVEAKIRADLEEMEQEKADRKNKEWAHHRKMARRAHFA